MKKLFIILILIAVGVGGYLVLRNNDAPVETVTKDVITVPASEPTLTIVPDDSVNGVRSYRIKKPTGWASSIDYSFERKTSSLIMMSPDYHDGPDDAYDGFQEGVSITVSERNDSQDKSITDLRNRIADSEMYNQNPIESLEVAGQPALRYYWGWEGNPAIITAFFRDGKSYSITFTAAKLNGGIPEGFASYMPLYEAVIGSFEFK